MENKYKILIPHFYCLEYYEGERKMVIDIDFRENPIILSTAMIVCWEQPNDNIIISQNEKQQIIYNIREYLLKNNNPERIVIEE